MKIEKVNKMYHTPLVEMEENVIAQTNIYNKTAWKENKNGDYLHEILRPTCSKIRQSEFMMTGNAPDDQKRGQNNGLVKQLRIVDEQDNRRHPTCGHPIIRPEQSCIWMDNKGNQHTFASQFNYNALF